MYNRFQIIGLNVKKYRKLKHLSQIDLAIAIGIDRSYISEIENGHTNFSVGILLALADFFEIDATDLFDKNIAENK